MLQSSRTETNQPKESMKSLLSYAVMLAMVLTTTLATRTVADGTTMPAEQTITGWGMCNKCVNHVGTECQTIIQSKEDGKTVTYYLVNNDVSKAFHKNVCTTKEKVKAMGTVQEVDGKMMLTASKLELVKD